MLQKKKHLGTLQDLKHIKTLKTWLHRCLDFSNIWNRTIKSTRCGQEKVHLLLIDDSSEEICDSEGSVDIATAGRHRGLSTIYIKHNPFDQSKLGPDIELQNTHIVLFNFPCDVMQVSTLGAQLGLGPGLVDWYWNAASVPYGHILIDLSPRTDDRLRFCTNTGSFPTKLYIPELLKLLKSLDDVHTKSLHSSRVPVVFRKRKIVFLQSCPK